MVRTVLAAAGVVAILVAAGCGSGTPAISTNVTSVTGTYEPYNPALRGGGVPAEQVDFTVTGYTSGLLWCRIDVFDNRGRKVGSTRAEAATDTNASGTIDESIPVGITGNIFDGTPANAKVSCETGG